MIPQRLLPPGTQAFIAGGWAACPSLATDMDIWVQVPTTDDSDEGLVDAELGAARLAILDHVREEYPCRYTVQDSTERNPGYTLSGHITIRKVAEVKVGPTKCHILVTNGSVEDVLNGFDISTHQVAITQEGRVVKGAQWTSVCEAPVVIHNTPTTPERLVKIQKRYGLA